MHPCPSLRLAPGAPRGYKHIGRSFWSGNGVSRHCAVFLYELSPHRVAS